MTVYEFRVNDYNETHHAEHNNDDCNVIIIMSHLLMECYEYL